MTWQLIEQTETKRVWKPMNTEQRDTSHLNQPEPNTADPKPIPTSFSEWLEQNGDSIDRGGNWIPDRVEANEDQYGDFD